MTQLFHGIAETTITTGIGTLSLGGHLPDTASFSSRYAVGDTAPYVLKNGINKEWGIGTVGAGNTLARTTITGTLVSGVYTVGGTAIALSGASQVEVVEHEGNDFQTAMAAHIAAALPHGTTYTTPAQVAASVALGNTVMSLAYNTIGQLTGYTEAGVAYTVTYNTDGTLNTLSDGTTTRTASYNPDGSFASYL